MSFGIYGESVEVSHCATARKLETGERVRARFNNDMAAHVWAQRSQTFGQGSKGVVYFHGRALFDYGAHYCAAYIMADDSAVLVNASHASLTTSAHVSTARHAARPRRAVYVPDLTGLLAGRAGASLHPDAGAQSGEVEATQAWEAKLDARLADRARVRDYCEAHALELSRDAMQYLLSRVGLPSSADKIRREAEAARDKAKREADAARKRAAVQELRDFAGAPDLPAYMLSKWNHFGAYGAEALANAWARHIRKARKWAGKANVPGGIWRKAWERLQSLDDERTLDALAAALGEAESRALAYRRRRDLANALTNWKAPTAAHHMPDADAGEFRKLSALRSHLDRRGVYAGRLAEALRALYPNAHGGTADKLETAADCLGKLAQNLADSDAFKAARARFDAERIEAERIEREAKERKRAEALAAWLAGEPGRLAHHESRESGAAYIRATGVERNASGDIVGGRLETSQGADVPLVEAVRAFRFIKLVRERGKTWHANGARIRVGHFELDRIHADGTMRAGCHLFEWRDVEALARQLGVFELAPDDSAVTRNAHA